MGKNNDLLNSRLFEGFSETSDRRYIYICDMSRDMSRWSQSAVEYFGLPGEYIENAGEIWAAHIHPDDRQRYMDDIAEVFEGRKEWHELDYRAMNKYGDYVICTCKGKVMRGEDGEPDIFIGSLENHGIADRVDAASGLYNVYEFLQDIRDLKNSGKTAVELLIERIQKIQEELPEHVNAMSPEEKAFLEAAEEQRQATFMLRRKFRR